MLFGGSLQLDHELTNGDSIDSDEVSTGEIQLFYTPGPFSRCSSRFSCTVRGRSSLATRYLWTGDMLVYDNALASVQSIKRLRRLAGIRVLLSVREEPRNGVVSTDGPGS